ncbi:hypothetical protein [Peredibacter starrii]|uniref:Uncharacterized protein n=1 Tax=Peredibacter starrii TaxID=28202 RepID=A0AAX4HRE4_9BACT|nr:hypothetical protein [Peredibacter starrii]WPU65807.1 hypothetical protein SOO65_03510 [Peredibacter starrii]
MKDYSDLSEFSDKKLRTLRNNINNRLESFGRGGEKNLPPSHMLHGMDDGDCRELLTRVLSEMKNRAKQF